MSTSSNSLSSDTVNGPSEKIPGTISIRLVRQSHSEWYTISEKHIGRIINDSEGFRIIFSHPLPPKILSWITTNLHSNCRFQLFDDNTLLWLDDPKKNFRCYKCKVLYEEEQSESNSENDSKFEPEPTKPESEFDLSANLMEKVSSLKDWNIPISKELIIPKDWDLSKISQYQVKSPTLLLLLLSFSFMFDWTAPFICISVMSLGLSSFQEK